MSNGTIVVTGASGFIAKHIVVQLLNAGYRVRGTVRNAGRADEARAVVAKHTPANAHNLALAMLDLDGEEGWQEALGGADALIHTASPFPLVQPKDEQDVIRPAVEGTLRALRAAKAHGVKRAVMTSSVLALMYPADKGPRSACDERDWTNVKDRRVTAYAKSKTLAERAAWDFVQHEGNGLQFTAIHPAFVLGRPLDRNFGTSLRVIQRLLRGKDPMLPNFGFPTVGVEDIALMHVRALERSVAIGQRYVGGDEFLWFPQMAAILKDAFPERRIVTAKAPDFVIRLLGLFDAEVSTIVNSLSNRDEVTAEKARKELGVAFKPASQAVREAGRFLIESAQI